MARRRIATRAEDRQVSFAWSDPAEVIDRAVRRGAVVFEAPEASEIRHGRTPRVPRVKTRAPQEPPSLGLPFGVREVEGHVTCWSCAEELSEGDLVRNGPGNVVCPGCGARLPFVD